jgi:hypothetical protein
MNICIVGGLGYLGLPIARKLSAGGHNVQIMDINLFKKFNDTEIKRIGIPVVNRDLRDFHNDANMFSGFDTVVVACLPDDKKFLNTVFGKPYNEELLEICTKVKSKVSGDVYSIGGKEGLTHECEHTRMFCPTLYGVTQAFRNDTMINKMVLDFITQQAYRLEVAPFDTVDFCSLDTYVKWFVNHISRSSDALQYDVLPSIMLANIVQWEFGVEYALHMTPEERRGVEINGCFSMRQFEELKNFIVMVRKAFEDGPGVELLDEQYNNAMQYEYISGVEKYRSFIR